MADSKFLKWQDIDRDGLIDVCDDDLRTPPAPCKGPCVPDPFSIVPDWKKLTVNEPFLNTKICHFQITKPTPYDSTADIDLINANEDGGLDEEIDLQLKEKFKEFELEVINNLLDLCPIVGARLNNEETRAIVRKAIEYKKYDLRAGPGSRLKLLYSVPFDILYYLADPPIEEEPDEAEEEGPGWEKFTYNAEHIMTDAIRVRKGLNFYSKLLKVSVQIGEGNAYFVSAAGTPTHIFSLEDYGDVAIGYGETRSSSLMKAFINDLKTFLANKGKALPDGGPHGDPFGPIFDDKVTKIKFSFKNKEIRVMRVYTKNCGNKPAIYTKKSGSLRWLLGQTPWQNETAVHYFINMKKMASQLSSRVQLPWRQFIEEHTYPSVKITHFPVEQSLDSCLYGHLRDEVNEMGNDILDEIFGLGDLVAYLYNDTLCRSKLEEVLNDDKNLNQVNQEDPQAAAFSKEVAKILARNQKYKKLRADDDVVMRACVTVLSPLSMAAGGLATVISSDIKGAFPAPPGGGGKNGVWMEVLGDLKLCGLLDLVFETLDCLLGGLTLEDALPIIIKGALDVMGIENFGDLFIGLPPEQQERMDEIVRAKLSEKRGKEMKRQPLNTQSDPDGGFFEGFDPTGGLKDAFPPGVGQGSLKTMGESWKDMGGMAEDAMMFMRPWEAIEVIAAQRTATQQVHDGANYETEAQATPEQVEAEMRGTDASILSSLNSSRQASRTPPLGEIMTAYMEALMEVYSDNLLELIDELNNFPGAPLLRDLMALTGLKCPRPALFTPSLDSFMKSLDLAFCRKVKEIEIPSINLAALELKIAFKDMLGGMMRVARFLIGMIILIVVNQLIAKVCEILSKAVCKALETTGDLLKGLPGAISGSGPTLMEILRENICGEGVDDETLENSIVDLMATLALGPAAFADREKTIQFANDLSSAVTRQEFADALTGNPSEEFVEAVDQMLEYVHTDFRDALPNKNSIARFAKNIGNFMPLEFREVLIDYSNNAGGFDDGTPANPSICSSPEQMMKFKELRCELLGSRVSKKQCEKLFCDLRDETLSDLEDLQTIVSKGAGEWVADKVPSIMSIPGCDDGLLPFETSEMINMTTGFLEGTLDALESEWLDDMLGHGFTLFGGGDRNFGFINMVLCDTRGNPLSNHHRKASNRRGYVNFAANLENGGEKSSAFRKKDFSQQEGQYPYYVAEWLKRQYLNAANVDGTFSPGFNQIGAGGNDLKNQFSFKSTNTPRDSKHYNIDLDDLGYANIFGRQGISTFTAPDFGYNTIFNGVDRKVGADIAEGLYDLATAGMALAGPLSPGALLGAAGLSTDFEGSTLRIERLPRKGNPSNGNALGPDVSNNKNGADIVLNFKDNAMGSRKGIFHEDFGGAGTNKGGNEWSYGFEVQCYYSDIELVPGTFEGELRNRPDDNIRVQIVEKVNFGCDRRFASPMAKQVAAEETRLPPFDFPNWIENVPIVGWALESVVKLFLLPFSALISGILNLTIYAASEKIHRMRAYEFLAIDDGLDAFKVSSDADPNKEKSLDINKFPNYANSTTGVKPYAPQIYALADLLGQSPSQSLKTDYDQMMTMLYKDFAKIIGTNKSGWLYGAAFDFISEDDYEYGVVRDGDFIPYDDLDYEEEDMVLGISRNQHRLGKENARVIYLDPLVFGGKFTKPPMHVKTLRYDGWWGMVQAFFPDDTACKPHGKNLLDFSEIKKMIENHYPTLPEDTRLYEDIECVRQVPFDRILPRHAKMGLYTLILAAIRIYASTHIMKSVGTFSAIQPKFPDNFGSVFSAYVIERMEEDFKDAQPAFWEAFNVFKDEEFWYGFLEQAVECYDFLVNAGELPEPVGGGYLQRAADTINNLQTNYAYAYRTKDVRDYTDQNSIDRTQKVPGLWESKWAGDAGMFETLRGFRERKNFEGIKSVEDEAKVILQELVNYEFSKMGEKFVKNMQQNGFHPEIFDLDYWIFEKKCVDSSIKIVGPNTIDVSVGLPSRKNPDPFGTGASLPGPYFTPGGQFRITEDVNEEDEFGYADEYVGYYHVHIDDDGDEVYMTGAIHSDDAHDIIVPVADILQVATTGTTVTRYPDGNTSLVNFVETEEITVPIGDVPDYASGAGSYSDSTPFKLEKYISIDGVKKSTTEARDEIRAQSAELRISDIWPGTLKLITNDDGVDVGIEGNIGVRHGLAFYYKGTLVTSVEVDALDFKTAQFQPVQANSKLLHCLLQHLKHDPKYKLLMSYVFSMKKITSTLAIYNDMGFLASVGEVPPGKKDGRRWLATTSRTDTGGWFFGKKANTNTKSDWMNSSPFEVVRMKPGSRVFVKTQNEKTSIEATDRNKEIYGLPDFWDDDLEFDATVFDVHGSGITGNEGWEHPKDRPWATPFTLNWDEWDRVLLRNSRARIKSLFRTHYYAADKKPGQKNREKSPVHIKLRNLKARVFPTPGAGMLPWWQRRRLRQNPYNADDEMCDGPDVLGDRSGRWG